GWGRGGGPAGLGGAWGGPLGAPPGRPGGETPPIAFLRMLNPVVPSAGNGGGTRRWVFAKEDFRKEWSQYLVSRDRLLVLEKLLSPLVADLDRRMSEQSTRVAPVAWARWFPIDAF